MKIAVFPGSFNPITLGHMNIIERSLPLFDKIIIAIGVNLTKPVEDLKLRKDLIASIYPHHPRIDVTSYTGFTTKFCEYLGAEYILRGIRNSTDFEYEKTIAEVNKHLNPNIETVFLMTAPHLSNCSSSIVRELIKISDITGDVVDLKPFLAEEIIAHYKSNKH